MNFKSYSLIMVLALCSGIQAMEKEYDLTNPLLVAAWAHKQGLTMTTDEIWAFANEQQAQRHAKKQTDAHQINDEIALIAAKMESLELAILKNNNNAPAMEPALVGPQQDYDLTNIEHVIAWAKKQGMTMNYDEALSFAEEQQNQIAIQQALTSLENAPMAKPEPQADIASEKANVDECPLCLEDLEDNVVPVGPNCIHKTHTHCLAEIKQKYTECPVCKAAL